MSKLPSGREVRVTLADSAPTDVLTARDPFPRPYPVSAAFFRRKNTCSAIFVWCIALDGQPVQLQTKTFPGGQQAAPAVAVQLRNTTGHQWNILINPDLLATPGLPLPARYLAKYKE